jgi:cystathionine beta-lyase/cystathionine gamma-synthase
VVDRFADPPELLLLRVGLENVEDLWRDLEQALAG